jgi:threonine dehydrogenase-like Zn-dependent dehydrogenase
MRAAVLIDVCRMELRDIPTPELRADEVLVRVQAVGLCGTDLHIFAGHGNYNRDADGRVVPLAEAPQILGHEIAGVIAEVGAEVRDLRAGDRVILDQGRSCVGERRSPLCEYCATGDSHQCEFYREHGITGLPGGFAEFIAVPAVNAVRIESDLDPAESALAEPIGCVVHSTHMLEHTPARYTLRDITPGQRIRAALICGAGASGLIFVQYLRNVLGFEGQLLVSEPNARRRALAVRFGAEGIDPGAVDIAAAVREQTGGRRVELLIDASGSGPVFARIPELIRKQATVLLYGHGHTGVELSVLNGVQFIEPTLLAPTGASGGFEPDGRPSTYVRALRLLETGRIDARSLITHRYASLESIPGALTGDHRSPEYVKGVVAL